MNVRAKKKIREVHWYREARERGGNCTQLWASTRGKAQLQNHFQLSEAEGKVCFSICKEV